MDAIVAAEVLGVDPTAEKQMIKQAFRQLPVEQRNLAHVIKAYQTLSSPQFGFHQNAAQ